MYFNYERQCKICDTQIVLSVNDHFAVLVKGCQIHNAIFHLTENPYLKAAPHDVRRPPWYEAQKTLYQEFYTSSVFRNRRDQCEIHNRSSANSRDGPIINTEVWAGQWGEAALSQPQTTFCNTDDSEPTWPYHGLLSLSALSLHLSNAIKHTLLLAKCN